jgi:hypothetical protein
VLREVADRTGTRIDPGGAPRHVAVMAWDPEAPGNDPGALARLAKIGYGADLVLYPAPGSDHSALARLLSDLADDRFGLAEHARAVGDLGAADRHATEPISIAAPRGLVPAQAAALTAGPQKAEEDSTDGSES